MNIIKEFQKTQISWGKKHKFHGKNIKKTQILSNNREKTQMSSKIRKKMQILSKNLEKKQISSKNHEKKNEFRQKIAITNANLVKNRENELKNANFVI